MYPEEKALPRGGLCADCNFQDICLRDFYLEHETKEDVL